jgi:hypothetical protein
MVTAKFKVTRITPWGNFEIVDGQIQGECKTAEVELTPDYSNGRNAEWAGSTPAGVIRLTIANPAALARFKSGQAFTVTFEENDE